MSVAAAEIPAAHRAAMARRAEQISTVVPAPRSQSSQPSQQSRPSRPLPAPASRRPRAAAARPAPARAGRGGSSSFYSQARAKAPTTRVHRTNYQPVILAEFVAAVLLVALSPVATRTSPGISPYQGKDMIKIGAVTAVYFLLALVSATGQEAGRFAAWGGGLILLTVGLAEAAHLAQILDLGGIGGGPKLGPANAEQIIPGINNAFGGPPPTPTGTQTPPIGELG